MKFSNKMRYNNPFTERAAETLRQLKLRQCLPRDLTSGVPANRVVDTFFADLTAGGSVYVRRSRDDQRSPLIITMSPCNADRLSVLCQCPEAPRSLSFTASLGRSSSSALCCHALRLLRRRTLPEGLFIYFEIQHPTTQHQNYKVHNTHYADMDTRGRASRHLHSTRKIK